MADVSKVPGPVGPPNSPRSGRTDKTDPDAFKKLTKTGEVDPEQKGKKRSFAGEDAHPLATTKSPAENKTAASRPVGPPQYSPGTGQGTPKADHETKPTIESKGKLPASKPSKPPQPKEGRKDSHLAEKPEDLEEETEETPQILHKPAESQPHTDESEEEKNQEIQGPQASPRPLPPEPKLKEPKSVEKEVSSLPTSSVAPGPAFLPPASQIPPGYTHLRPETFALFERMVSVISVMHASGIKETTIHLNTPEFASSIFAGTQITIREYSTAPRAYNIELVGAAQSMALFEQNIDALHLAFKKGGYGFQVHDIRASLRPTPHRRVEKPKKASEGGE